MATVETQVVKETDLLIEKFEKFFSIYEAIKPLIVLSDTQEKYFEDRREWLNRLKQTEFPVAFFGAFSVGKSTIINAILRQDILPEGTKSTTAFPTIIRRGQQNKAIVFYLDENAKTRLRGQIIGELRSVVGENTPLITDDKGKQKDNQQYLTELQAAISKYEEESKNKFDRDIFNKLSVLLLNWNKFDKPSISIQLNELSNYVQGHDDSLFIDRIEVYLSNIDLPDDVILVDLPGLKVKNPRHIEFTKQYIRKEAKAFVICLKPNDLLEGEEAEFLVNTNKSEPTVLTRSFWLINKWDSSLHGGEKSEEERNFYEKVRENSFRLGENRFFKVSALRYSLIHHLINGTLSSSERRLNAVSLLKDLFGELSSDNIPDSAPTQASKFLEEIPEIRDFETFRKSLFEYLNVTAKKEFLADAKSELMNCVLELRKHYPSHDKAPQNISDLKNSLKLVKAQKEQNSYFENIKDQIRSFGIEVEKVILRKTLWKQESHSRLERAIDVGLTKDEELEMALNQGAYNVKGLISELPPLIRRRLAIEAMLLKEFTIAVESTFIAKLHDLRGRLYSHNQSYLPMETQIKLSNELDKRYFETRLSGMADTLFRTYTEELEKIAAKVLTEATPKDLDKALSTYSEGLKKFFKGFEIHINDCLKMCIKNHTEQLKNNLLAIYQNDESLIFIQIIENMEYFDIEMEVSKTQAISNSYNSLVNLQSSI